MRRSPELEVRAKTRVEIKRGHVTCPGQIRFQILYFVRINLLFDFDAL